MYRHHIKLEEAMSIALPYDIRVWELAGFHASDENMPENANVEKSFVMKSREGKIRFGIEWTVEGELGSHMGIVAEVSALKELKDQFPKLFELEGSLYAFS